MDVGQAARSGRLDADRVRTMFNSIAGIYDLMNTAMTAGQHHRWRQRAVGMARVGPGSRVLDVATGTGDMAIELARHVSPGGEVVGSDFSEAMLERARAKVDAGETDSVRPKFVWADAMTLPYAMDSFDSATVGFGARNFEDLAQGLSEMVRVVRPGGRVVVLEITTPTRPILSRFYRVWFDRIVPLLGRLAGAGVAFASRLGGSAPGDAVADAYTYLPSSVKRFPEPAVLAAELARAGLTEVSYVLMAGGIVAVHAGTVTSKQA